MKKIGILTFHKAANYGAVLQAYALENAIAERSNKIEVEIIDYYCKKIEDSYAVYNPNTGNIKKEIIRLPFCAMKRIRKRKIFNDFVSHYLVISNKRYTFNTIAESIHEYDAFIVGSDQIWNDILTNKDLHYCLDFVPERIKKFSYAASFGNVSNNQDTEKKYMEAICQFQSISVRELSSKEKLVAHGRKDCFVSPDPTFLLEKKQWIEFARFGRKLEKQYVLIYELTPGRKLVEFAKSLAVKNKLKVVFLNESYTRHPEIEHIRGANPVDFVSLIQHAKYVVTNSFHGTAFSIICNTNFWVETISQKNTNNRICNLLQIFHLENRDISENVIIDKEIDWKQVNTIKNQIKADTERYLNFIVNSVINRKE